MMLIREESELPREVYVACAVLLRIPELGCGFRNQAGQIHRKIKFKWKNLAMEEPNCVNPPLFKSSTGILPLSKAI